MPWIEFTHGEDNSPLLLNTDRMEVAIASGKGTDLYFPGGSDSFYRVNQSYIEVRQMITEAEGF